ncbi:MAG: DUF1269 domain-containing protein [Beijerinckiaceae bacterium]
MRTLFAVTYRSVAEARDALAKLSELQKGQTITLADAVIVSRKPDGSVKLDQAINTAAIGAMSGAVWGSLIGLIFLAPAIGAAVGAATGAASGYFTDFGISDDFMKGLAEKVEGESATLFVLAADMTVDRVASAIGSPTATLLYTSLAEDVETRFKQRLAQQNVAGTMPMNVSPMSVSSAL